MSKERPILFSGPMVVALLAGRKTQTRRIVEPQPPEDWSPDGVEWYHPTKVDRHGEEYPGPLIFGAFDEERGYACPYGGPGDRLWVKETWAAAPEFDHLRPKEIPKCARIWYRATDDMADAGKVRTPLFMVRWMSRIALPLTAVRAERLHAITESDAVEEGAELAENPDYDEFDPCDDEPYTFVAGFMERWEVIHGEGAWEANPLVWALSFDRVAASAEL